VVRAYLGLERFGERIELKDVVDTRRRRDADARRRRGVVELCRQQVVHGQRQSADDAQ